MQLSNLRTETDSPVREEIRNLSVFDKAAYFEALDKCPKLLEIESPENSFLAVEDGNVEKAALRLARYWKVRKELFTERAFLPMDQSGKGALDDKCLDMLATGYLLPMKCDALSCPLFAFDPSRFTDLHSFPMFDDTRLQTTFYYLHVAAESPVAQSQGVRVLTHLKASPRRDIHRHSMRMIKDAFPIRTVVFHAMVLPSTSSFGVFTERLVDLYQLIVEPFTSHVCVLRGSTDQEVLDKVKTAGFSIQQLPDWMGGKFTIQDFEDWRTRRRDIELQRFLSPAEKAAKRREKDAARARKKREAIRKEESVLLQHVEELREANRRLQAEHQQLEMLATYAQAEIQRSHHLQHGLGWNDGQF